MNLGLVTMHVKVTYIFGSELNTVIAFWRVRHYQVCVIAHSGPRATRQVLRCQACRCLLHILLAAEGHTRLEPHMTKAAAHVQKSTCESVHWVASDTRIRLWWRRTEIQQFILLPLCNLPNVPVIVMKRGSGPDIRVNDSTKLVMKETGQTVLW